MIQVTFHYCDDTRIAGALMHHTPYVNEIIWLLPADKRKSAFIVKEVAHWVSDAKHFQEQGGYHHACVYVEDIE